MNTIKRKAKQLLRGRYNELTKIKRKGAKTAKKKNNINSLRPLRLCV